MGIDLTPLWVIIKIIIIIAILALVAAGYLFFSKKDEIVTKKPIVPALIIEKKGSKVDTTYVYRPN